MTTVLNAVGSTPPWLLLSLVFVLPALEASTFLGLIVPGETMVILGGVAAHAGRVTLAVVILLAVSGAVLGDQLGYLVGRRYGPALVARLPVGSRRAGHVAAGLDLLRIRGVYAVGLGRWVATLRSVVPSIAGMSGMGRRSFTVANVLGGSAWAASVATAGYLAGASFRVLEDQLGTSAYVMMALCLVSVAAWWAWSKRRRRATTTTQTGARVLDRRHETHQALPPVTSSTVTKATTIWTGSTPSPCASPALLTAAPSTPTRTAAPRPHQGP